jgi:hypothetical protein
MVAISETAAPIASRMRQNIGAALVGNLFDLWWFRAVHRGVAREGDRLVDGAVLLRNGGGCDQLHGHRPHSGNRAPPA